MVQPTNSNAPMPHTDLPEELKKDYEEARDIISRSSRNAAALLRLLIEKLIKKIINNPLRVNETNTLNDNVIILAERGLSKEIKEMLDIMRVTGNRSVPPGKIDDKDDAKTALALFKLVNLIVEKMITEPKHLESLRKDFPNRWSS